MSNQKIPPRGANYLASLRPLPDPEVWHAHDVKALACCECCGALGDRRHMLEEGTDSAGWPLYFHGRCFVALFGLPALLARPKSDRGAMRLSDVGPQVMGCLLDMTGKEAHRA